MKALLIGLKKMICFFGFLYGYWQLLPRAKLQVTSCVWGKKKRKEWDKNQRERREGGKTQPKTSLCQQAWMGLCKIQINFIWLFLE